jgi:hypothetical protein
MAFSGGKIMEIHEHLSNYCIVNKPKLDFLYQKRLSKPVFNEKNYKEAIPYREELKKEFSEIHDGIPDKTAPEAYKNQFLDDILSFKATEGKDKKGIPKTNFYFAKSFDKKDRAEKFKEILGGGALSTYKNNSYFLVRLSKKESVDLAKRLISGSIEKEFYAVFLKGCEHLNDTVYTKKIKSIKNEEFDESILTGLTQAQKITKSLEEKNLKRSIQENKKKEELERTKSEKRILREQRLTIRLRNKEEKVEMAKERRIANKAAKRAARIEKDTLDILRGSKTCKKCQKNLPLIAFTVTRHGVIPTCKQCYYDVHKEKSNARAKKYQKENREKIRAYEKIRKSLPVERMRASMKNRLKSLFFRKGDTRTAEILGMSLPDFKLHIQSQFKTGMSWDNYGSVWDVDHIIPCRAFDHSIREHVLLCWNHKNLRPEFKTENYSKHDKMENGLSARAMMENQPELLFEIRNQMLRQIGLPEIRKESKTEQIPEEAICLNIF